MSGLTGYIGLIERLTWYWTLLSGRCFTSPVYDRSTITFLRRTAHLKMELMKPFRAHFDVSVFELELPSSACSPAGYF